jgi:hypothetical protein
MALNIQGSSDMANEYPKLLFHENGQHRTVRNEEEAKALGGGWSDKMNDNSIMGIRKAAGSIAEVIEPAQVTVQGRTIR